MINPDNPPTIREFETLQDAKQYRKRHGTGGWIFQPAGESRAILFPPDMTPSAVCLHPMTRDLSGAIV